MWFLQNIEFTVVLKYANDFTFKKCSFHPILMLFHLNVREDIVELVSDASLPLPVFLSVPRQAHRSPFIEDIE